MLTPDQEKRIEEIEERLEALEESEGNYCERHTRLHSVETHAPADLRFLLDLLEEEQPNP